MGSRLLCICLARSNAHQYVTICQNDPGEGILAGAGALTNGGDKEACLQHFTLRFLLVRNGFAPWNYLAFLDSAAERLFLRKVGGGYVFIHRMLLEYFAGLDTSLKRE